MGQKINPHGLRVGVNLNWKSRWFLRKGGADSVIEDIKIRRIIDEKLFRSQISKVEIEKASSQIVVTIHTARPGIVIGQKGVTIDALREDLAAELSKDVRVNVSEIKNPHLDAQIVSEMVAVQIERKMPFRSVCKRMIRNVIAAGAKGVKIKVAGRLGGAEIARKEWFKDGSVPLQTISRFIDYGFSKAFTRYGIIGVKVWIHKDAAEPAAAPAESEEKVPHGLDGEDEKEKGEDKV
ncbi:MAG: 30S ribosomal protein S3 [Elusimicrobia bacterium]|nr:30S ribosomal protein S3 [Elusimicrobiota bacterium]